MGDGEDGVGDGDDAGDDGVGDGEDAGGDGGDEVGDGDDGAGGGDGNATEGEGRGASDGEAVVVLVVSEPRGQPGRAPQSSQSAHRSHMKNSEPSPPSSQSPSRAARHAFVQAPLPAIEPGSGLGLGFGLASGDERPRCDAGSRKRSIGSSSAGAGPSVANSMIRWPAVGGSAGLTLVRLVYILLPGNVCRVR